MLSPLWKEYGKHLLHWKPVWKTHLSVGGTVTWTWVGMLCVFIWVQLLCSLRSGNFLIALFKLSWHCWWDGNSQETLIFLERRRNKPVILHEVGPLSQPDSPGEFSLCHSAAQVTMSGAEAAAHLELIRNANYWASPQTQAGAWGWAHESVSIGPTGDSDVS